MALAKQAFSLSDLERLRKHSLTAGSAVEKMLGLGLNAKKLSAAGITAKDLLGNKFYWNDLKAMGYTARSLLKETNTSLKVIAEQASFSALDLLKEGFSRKELLQADFFPSEIDAAFKKFHKRR